MQQAVFVSYGFCRDGGQANGIPRQWGAGLRALVLDFSWKIIVKGEQVVVRLVPHLLSCYSLYSVYSEFFVN